MAPLTSKTILHRILCFFGLHVSGDVLLLRRSDWDLKACKFCNKAVVVMR